MSYDAIVVGARCAGAPTAMLLARAGFKVLMVDAAQLPSDQPLSTHFVWASGAERLRRWGLLDQVRATGCPPVRRFLLDFGAVELEGSPVPAGELAESFSPRRRVLDPILLNAALAAGVEFRPDFEVTGLSADGDRVDGIEGRSAGARMNETASIVIGADGRASKIAQLVDAAPYDEVPPRQGTYFGYWRDLPLERMELHTRPGRAVYAFPTNDGLTLVGCNWAIGDFRAARADPPGAYLAVLDDCAPALAAQVRCAGREGELIGGAIGNVMRTPSGPGWALVGDAGVTMDPCTAAGINNAFRDAEILVEAVADGLTGARPMAEALADFHLRRDRTSKPIYDFTCDLAALAPPSDDLAALLAALAGNPAETARFIGLLAQTVSPTEFFAPESIGRILQAAA